MKEAWCLATSLTEASGAEVVALYGRRFCMEERFRGKPSPSRFAGPHNRNSVGTPGSIFPPSYGGVGPKSK